MILRNFFLFILLLASYLLSFSAALSEEVVFWAIAGGIFATITGLAFAKNMLNEDKAGSVLSMGATANFVFVMVGPYLNSYIPKIAIVTSILGLILSFICMAVIYSYLKQKQPHKVRIKRVNKEEEAKKKAQPSEKVKNFLWVVNRQSELKGQYPLRLRWQVAYVDLLEELQKKEEKNAVDFIIGKKVNLENTEIDA